jgi:hypothetical protein
MPYVGTFWDTGARWMGEWVDTEKVQALFKAPQAGRMLRVKSDARRSASDLHILDLKRATQVFSMAAVCPWCEV